MLESGNGIIKNKEEAAHFYKLSAEKGNDVAMKNYAQMLEKRDGIPVNKKEAVHYYQMAIQKSKTNMQ